MDDAGARLLPGHQVSRDMKEAWKDFCSFVVYLPTS
jgi:hypothetical protein